NDTAVQRRTERERSDRPVRPLQLGALGNDLVSGESKPARRRLQRSDLGVDARVPWELPILVRPNELKGWGPVAAIVDKCLTEKFAISLLWKFDECTLVILDEIPSKFIRTSTSSGFRVVTDEIEERVQSIEG